MAKGTRQTPGFLVWQRGGLHKVCYDGAGDDAGESGQKGAEEGVAGILDFGGYVVDA